MKDQKKVLIIEDEQLVADSLQRLFEFRYPDVKVIVAGSVQSARESLLNHHYEAVIADYNLPDGTGYQLLLDMAQILPWLSKSHVVFFSGVSYVDMIPEFRIATSFFTNHSIQNKPLDVSRLFASLDPLLVENP